MNRKKKLFYFFNISVPLILGTLIYIFFKNGTYINSLVFTVFKADIPQPAVAEPLRRFLVCWASDMLWAYSLMFSLELSLKSFRRPALSALIISLFFSALTEALQYFRIIGGTFDLLDIISEFASVFTAYSIIKRSYTK